MSIKILGADGSPFVRKVKVALAEKSIPFEQEQTVPFGVSDEFKAKSPLGKIPCLVDGDYALPDSSVISQYLERLQPSPSLYPSDAKEFGRALWYEEYADTKVVEVLTPFFFERIIKPRFLQQETDEARLKQIASETVPPVLDYLEEEIGDREYLAGGAFSIADVAVASPFVNASHAGQELDAARWPKLASYLGRVHARPSYKGCIEAEKAAFSG